MSLLVVLFLLFIATIAVHYSARRGGPSAGIGLALLSVFLALPAGAQDPHGIPPVAPPETPAPGFADTIAGATATEAPGHASPSYDWGSWTYTQYLLKAGQDKKAIFGARVTGWLYQGRLTVAGDLDASATQDGGATEGSVNVLDPRTFQSAAGSLVAYYDVVQLGALRVSAAGVVGVQVDIEEGRIQPRERYPVTAAGGVRLGLRGASLFVVGGKHDDAGPGFKVGVRAQIPLKGISSFVGTTVVNGPLKYAIGGIALSLR